MEIVTIILTLFLALACSVMAAALGSLSTHHLRHLAKQNDPVAEKLYPLKARGAAVWLTLEMFKVIFLVIAICMLSVRLTPWLLGLLAGLFIFLTFSLVAGLFLKSFGMRLLVLTSEPVLEVAHALKFITLPLGRMLDNLAENQPETLTSDEFKRTLQKLAPEGTNLNASELGLLKGVLDFGGIKVEDVMLPKGKLKLVQVDEILTPVVLDELHRNGRGYFPVTGSDKEVVGILDMKDVMDIHSQPEVAKEMQKAVFVGEADPLDVVIRQFYETKQVVFAVKNEAEDFSGLVALEAVLHKLLPEKAAEQTVAQKEDVPNDEARKDPASDEQIAETGVDVVELPL